MIWQEPPFGGPLDGGWRSRGAGPKVGCLELEFWQAGTWLAGTVTWLEPVTGLEPGSRLCPGAQEPVGGLLEGDG